MNIILLHAFMSTWSRQCSRCQYFDTIVDVRNRDTYIAYHCKKYKVYTDGVIEDSNLIYRAMRRNNNNICTGIKYDKVINDLLDHHKIQNVICTVGVLI